MSFEYHASFEMGPQRPDGPSLNGFLCALGIAFSMAASRFVCEEDGFVAEEPCPGRDWQEFVANLEAPTCLNGTFNGGNYRFTLGFVFDKAGSRRCLMAVSDRNFEKIAEALAARGTDFLRFLVGLCDCLGATSGAVGILADYRTVISFLAGNLPMPDVDKAIRVAIDVSPPNDSLLRSNPLTREFHMGRRLVQARWMPGLDQYFPRVQ